MSLYIAGFRALARNDKNAAPIATGHPAFEGVVTVGGTSAQSAAIPATEANTLFVRLFADEACHIAIGSNPTATTSNALKLPSGGVEWVGLNAGDKIAVIAGA